MPRLRCLGLPAWVHRGRSSLHMAQVGVHACHQSESGHASMLFSAVQALFMGERIIWGGGGGGAPCAQVCTCMLLCSWSLGWGLTGVFGVRACAASCGMLRCCMACRVSHPTMSRVTSHHGFQYFSALCSSYLPPSTIPNSGSWILRWGILKANNAIIT